MQSLRGTILHLAAFGDEMNKSRAMTARAARVLASRGFGVLQIDFFGCGDSAGEHADATLARWTDNATAQSIGCANAACRAYIRGYGRCARCAVDSAVARAAAPDAPLLLWQPILSGAQQLNHLLRQKLAEDARRHVGERSGTRTLRERLRDGATLETGGYGISPTLADELDRATSLPSERLLRSHRVAGSGRIGHAVALAGGTQEDRRISIGRGAGFAATALEGPGFWQSTEIEQCHRLEEASISALTIGETSALSRDPAVI